ncbi:MAG: hypothetical protein PHT59_07835 [Candidatus Omnitrophica bacterium]|nr:hypothetical protein [Candidatus Omnitrophota bacterium]
MSECKKCHATIVWKKKPDGTFAPPENLDGTRHTCGNDASAGKQPGEIIGRLEDYTQGSAEFTVKGGTRKVYAITAAMQKDWIAAEYLMPVSNHPDIWLEFSVDAKNFILPGCHTTQRPDWASKMSDPTGGEVKKPAQNTPELPKDTCTSPQAESALPGDLTVEFKNLLLSTNRDGIGDLIKYLEESTDFFFAPSSTKYHDAEVGGLLRHSLKTYQNLLALSKIYSEEYEQDAMIIIALLHDLCKVNIYKQERKSLPRRKENGELELDDFGRKIWDEQVVYTVDDQYPLGHGEKSVIMLQRFIQLTDTEIFAIRWHMMAYDDSRNSYGGNLAITNASDKYRIIPLFHMADLAASFLEMKPAAGVQ